MELLELRSDATGTFIDRPNRFLANVLLNGERVKAHVHDPGRLCELLVPRADILMRKASAPERRTAYDVLAARYDRQWVLINSAIHRPISERILSSGSISPFGPIASMRSEVSVGRSRIDHLIVTEDEEKVMIEVKGCSLAEDGRAMFPDAPTARGAKHMEELIGILGSGTRAGLLVLVMRSDVMSFSPNERTDPRFSEAFRHAVDAGLEVHPMVLGYDGYAVSYLRRVPVFP
ncbi:MAG: DNA/RNA nuclease SfsA [Candidatus Thermoplasmatota archaeon]|nr:DNA/RNA nuclease SfsA [Candidatus Thermoplasmatota archaeon]